MTKGKSEKLQTFIVNLYLYGFTEAILSATTTISGKKIFQLTKQETDISVYVNTFTNEVEITMIIDGYKD